MVRRAVIIGLTGNIACGKSAIGQILQRRGAEYIDADAIVHQLLGPGSALAARVVERFGSQITGEDGAIDRARLGAIVFRDPDALRALEQILHPAVLEEIERRVRGSHAKLIVVDAIKLIESGFARRVDSLWVVTCSESLQIDRLTRSRGLTRAQALERIRAQPPQEEKARVADVVIHNDGSLEDLERKVDAALEQALGPGRQRKGDGEP